MITREDVLNCIIDMTIAQDYLDLDNDAIDKIAAAIYQKIVNNDTVYFMLPLTDTVMSHSINEKKIKRAIATTINTSKIAMGDMPLKDFHNIKKEWFNSSIKAVADNQLYLYNILNNIYETYEEENMNYFSTGLLDTIHKTKIIDNLNESLINRGIIFDEKDAEYFEKVRKNLPKLYLYWLALFFSDNQNYLTDALIRLSIEKVNLNNSDISFYFNVLDNLDAELEEDFDELTEEEIEFLI